jgi:hypothetical protein
LDAAAADRSTWGSDAAAADLLAALGDGLPDGELDAKAATGMATAAAAATPATTTRRTRTDMTPSFMDRMRPVHRPRPRRTVERP